MGLFRNKKNESNQIESILRSKISKLEEELQKMESIKNANEDLKRKILDSQEWKREREIIAKYVSRILIEKGMDESMVNVYSCDPLTLVDRLFERFELIDKKVKQEERTPNAEFAKAADGTTLVVEDTDAYVESSCQECANLRQQLKLQKEEFANKTAMLSEQIVGLRNENTFLLSDIQRLKDEVEKTHRKAEESIRLLSLEKEKELEEAAAKMSGEFNAILEETKAHLLEEREQSIKVFTKDVGPSIEEQIAVVKQQLIDKLQQVIATLLKVDYIISCNGNNTETEVMQESIRNGAQKTLEGLTLLDMSQSKSLHQAQTIIQEFLLKEMEPISCWMRKLAIYSAYANIPFMIDEGRTDGIRFDREATMWSYALLDDMLAGVGIKQIVPAPFIELISDGDYEDASESSTKNIGSFCPDYIQRIGRIDRIDAAGIIIDIADVGLMIDGQLFRKAKVII